MRLCGRRVGLLVVLSSSIVALAQPASNPVTVDDLMRLRSISDVRISPDGRSVAYIMSVPSFEKAAHVPTLYIVSTDGGTPARLTYTTEILSRPLPAASLRWSPDGSLLSFVAMVDGVPQVVAMRAAGGEPRPLTSMKEGVASYEWAPDGRRIGFLAPDPLSAGSDRAAQEQVVRGSRGPRQATAAPLGAGHRWRRAGCHYSRGRGRRQFRVVSRLAHHRVRLVHRRWLFRSVQEPALRGRSVGRHAENTGRPPGAESLAKILARRPLGGVRLVERRDANGHGRGLESDCRRRPARHAAQADRRCLDWRLRVAARQRLGAVSGVGADQPTRGADVRAAHHARLARRAGRAGDRRPARSLLNQLVARWRPARVPPGRRADHGRRVRHGT